MRALFTNTLDVRKNTRVYPCRVTTMLHFPISAGDEGFPETTFVNEL